MNLQARLEELLLELRALQTDVPTRGRAIVVTALENVSALVQYYKV
jgi:hypothetical protein